MASLFKMIYRKLFVRYSLWIFFKNEILSDFFTGNVWCGRAVFDKENEFSPDRLYKLIGDDYSLKKVALRFCFSNNSVFTVIPGVLSIDQLNNLYNIM